MNVRINPEHLTILEAARVEGDKLYLTGQLDRKTYAEVNKVLESIGGKWNRSAKAHVFDEPVQEMIEDILETGTYRRVKQDLGQFDTPNDLALRVVEAAEIGAGMLVLEPNAGIGNIVLRILDAAPDLKVYTCEIDVNRVHRMEDRIETPRYEGTELYSSVGDFLAWTERRHMTKDEQPLKFDRVVMNPPFAKQADIDHVMHAFRFLKPGGKLVAIMSASVVFRDNAKTKAFRDFVYSHEGTINPLPVDSFKSSGTSVNTCIVTMKADPA